MGLGTSWVLEVFWECGSIVWERCDDDVVGEGILVVQ